MLLELRRTGGFTGAPKRWQVDTGADTSWANLVDAAGLRPSGMWRRIAKGLIPVVSTQPDHIFDLWIDGKRTSFRGVDVTGALHDLVDRIMREGEENGSPDRLVGG